MAGFRLRFEALGETQLDFELRGIEGRGVDMRPAFEKIYDSFRKDERQLFDSQGRGTWPADALATVAAKRAKGLDPRVLHATGTLRRSLTRKHDPNADVIIARRFMVYGTKVDYAGIHQSGGGNVPQRRPLQFSEAAKVAAIKDMQRYLVTGEVVA